MKIQKKNWGGLGSGGGSVERGVGFVGGGGVRVDVNEELVFLCKFKKKFFLGGGGGGGGGWVDGVGWGVRVDVNEELKIFVKI